ncbi:YxiF family protein [Laceyella putida]|uniref:Uncharacterized protein n=1 Tax=Laceyella putida TaxID=110101 RepID=A0ABW2RLU6_9BACL
MNQEERKQRMCELISQNGRRRSRERKISLFADHYHLQIRESDFISMEQSHALKRRGYDLAWRQLVGMHCKDTPELEHELKQLMANNQHLLNSQVLYFDCDSNSTGGIALSLAQVFHIAFLECRKGFVDFLMVEKTLAFGMCVDDEEHDIVLTVWRM